MTEAIGSIRNVDASRHLATALLAGPRAQHYPLDLEHATGLSPTRLRPALDRFLRAGYITASTEPEDGRRLPRQFYTLTKTGKRELPAIRDLGKNGPEVHPDILIGQPNEGATVPDPAAAIVAALEEKRAEVEALFEHSQKLDESATATPEERSEAYEAYLSGELELLQDLDREGLQLSAEGLDAPVWFGPQKALTLDQLSAAENLEAARDAFYDDSEPLTVDADQRLATAETVAKELRVPAARVEQSRDQGMSR